MTDDNLKWVDKVGMVTMIGIIADQYPIDHGNCFSVIECDNDSYNEYRVVNFVYENYVKMLEDKLIELPIQIKLISENECVIHDYRIPDCWYSEHWCEVCCPRNLLPENQKLKFDRKVMSGDIKLIDNDGFQLIKESLPRRKINEWG